jgi:hypothetical protein
MKWLSIEKYDELNKKPNNCVFFVEEYVNERTGKVQLSSTLSFSRYFGQRKVTHYVVLPDLNEIKDKS